MILIRMRRNGPYVIDDEVRVIDADGVEHRSERRPVALCRCGRSGTKPFCDGSHRDEPLPPAPVSAADPSR